MKSPRKALGLVGAAGVLGAIGWLDFVTGYEISLFLFYAMLIAWVSWNHGLAWGLLFAFASAVATRWLDYESGERFSHSWILWERGLNGLVLDSFVAFSFHYFRRTLEQQKTRVRQLEGILPICVVCHRVRDEKGQWADMADYLRGHTEVQPEQRLCPECSKTKYLNDYLA